MKSFLVTIIIILLSANSFAQTWKYQIRLDGKGVVILGEGKNANLSEAFAKGDVSSLVMKRIAHIKSDTLQDDIHQYFKLNFPEQYYAALKSSGNMHNPAILPLLKRLNEALLSSRFFVNLNNQIVSNGYKITDISYEKFMLIKRHGVVSFDAFTWVSLEKSRNKTKHALPMQ